jgi:hypothetical protein
MPAFVSRPVVTSNRPQIFSELLEHSRYIGRKYPDVTAATAARLSQYCLFSTVQPGIPTFRYLQQPSRSATYLCEIFEMRFF